jgi:hypothetical protein
MLGEWTLFLEWCAAQGLNRVEWVLLEAKEWQSFSVSATRQQRLQTLVQIGQQWGMWIGNLSRLSFVRFCPREGYVKCMTKEVTPPQASMQRLR